MVRTLGLALLVVVGACVMDPARNLRPARYNVGMNARQLTSMAPRTDVANRGGSPEMERVHASAVSASGQFTMATAEHLYLGAEVEAGRLIEHDSNLAGAYAVAGVDVGSDHQSLGVEVAGGWRALRFTLDDEDHDQAIAEARVRGQIWLSSQLTAGAAVGASLIDRGWVAGIYLGVHSNLFGAFGEQ